MQVLPSKEGNLFSGESSIFALGNTREEATPLSTKNSSFSADNTRHFHVSIEGSHVASNCISEKVVKLTSTMEFHPSDVDPPIYLFVIRVTKNEETSVIEYLVKPGKKTMGDRHIKVFAVKD